MIITIDTETQGLDARRFLVGDIYTEDKKHELYWDKTKMWARILELGEEQKKYKKNLLVYAHNAIYDFLAIAPFPVQDLTVYCLHPFIAQLHNITFYDTMGLYRMGLDRVGTLLGLPKKEMPEWLKDKTHTPTHQELKDLIPYVQRDTEVTMESLLRFKQALREQGLRPRRVITIGQIAINYACKRMKESPHKYEWFTTERTERGVPLINYNKFWECQNKELIHQAYRGGRVQALQTGHFTNTTIEDINSSYSECASRMRVPNLNTETKIDEPLQHGWSIGTLLTKIGVTNCLIETPAHLKIGYLPIRQGDDNQYPTGKRYLIGTWNNYELRYALMLGYKIHAIQWGIIWNDASENPFKTIMHDLYEKRRETNDPYMQHFFKDLMNNFTGKLGQRRPYVHVKYDTVDKADEYEADGYYPIHGFGTYYVYQKKGEYQYKNYYAPIIIGTITSMARTRLYEYMKQFDPDDVLYTDTDSILHKHRTRYAHIFKYGTGLGEWKIQHQNVPALIYGKKTYSVADEIRMSGVSKHWLTLEAFERGIITYERLITMHNAPNHESIGGFEQITRDLRELQLTETTPTDDQELLVDTENTNDIPYYLPHIEQVTNT